MFTARKREYVVVIVYNDVNVICAVCLMQEMVGKYKANFYTLQGLTLESKKR